MNSDDVIDVTAVDKPQSASNPSTPADGSGESVKVWGWVSYILHLIVAVSVVIPGAQASLGLLLIALIMDLVKQSAAAGTWQASHFSWRIRSVIWAGVLYVLTSWLWLLLLWPGWVAWMVISIWFLYRIIKGMERMSAGQPVGDYPAR